MSATASSVEDQLDRHQPDRKSSLRRPAFGRKEVCCRRRREEFIAIGIDGSGAPQENPPSFVERLLTEAPSAAASIEHSEAESWLRSAHGCCDGRLAAKSTEFLHPESIEVVGVAAKGVRSV